MNIVGKRYWFFLVSILVIVPGVIGLLIWGMPLAIDFTGGSLLEMRFEAGKAPEPAEVVAVYDQLGILDPQVQSAGTSDIVARSKTIDDAQKAELISALEARFDQPINVLRFDSVGPSIGIEAAERAGGAVGMAALGILAFITYAFWGMPHAHRYGIAAIIAMLHDVAVVVGVEAFLGHFFGWEADSLFLTALLTVIGFSVHDTIVVFDRIRENRRLMRKTDFETLVNHSINQTMARSINTQLTVMLTLLSLLIFGGVTTRHFITVLMVGVFSGTYSSIFNAAPILVVWENQEWKTWFRRQPQTA
ncbi:MAG: protein translocase subunit SecF [Anaerolineales bacterium]|jgi:preprotein translocase subunit SecF